MGELSRMAPIQDRGGGREASRPDEQLSRPEMTGDKSRSPRKGRPGLY